MMELVFVAFASFLVSALLTTAWYAYRRRRRMTKAERDAEDAEMQQW